MHLEQHQQLLREAANSPGTPDQRAARIDRVMQQMRAENPEAFHIERGPKETLSQRVFMDQPVRAELNRGFYNFCAPRAA